jgi:uncharacterized OB-fold protein
MTHEVFICHSSNDASIANTICDALESKHINCWIAPRDVLPSRFWGEAVSNAIDRCRIVVLVISINSCQSSQVLMEVERAASRNIPILPVRIDDASISGAIGFFVSSRHWLDAHTPPLKKHLQKLADTIQQLLEQEPVTQTNINIRQTTSTILFKEDSEAVKAVQKVIICPRCGAKLRPSASFCNKCGTRIGEVVKDEAGDKEKQEAEEARKAKEAREKAEREAEEVRRAKEAREKAEREAEEARRAKEAREKAEREAEEARRAKEAREKAEREAEEVRRAKEAREKAEREAEEARKDREAREKAEREAEEARKTKEAQEKAEREAEEARRAKEAREKAEREAEEARKAKEAQEKAEREAEEARQAKEVQTSTSVSSCPKCGNRLRPGTGFCSKCGTRINEVEGTEAGDKAEREAEEVRRAKQAQEKAEREAEVVKPSAQTLYCPKCGYSLRPGAGFCDKCGASIDEAKRAKKAKERAEREAEEARKAKEAREKAEREAMAAKTLQQALYCPKCGYSLRPGAGFCDKCGTRISRG